jgi:hypothetical protein
MWRAYSSIIPTSTSRSDIGPPPPSLGPFSRGSSSDGLPSAVNISARRVVAMAAIIGDAHGGRQRINDTCTDDQRVR